MVSGEKLICRELAFPVHLFGAWSLTQAIAALYRLIVMAWEGEENSQSSSPGSIVVLTPEPWIFFSVFF